MPDEKPTFVTVDNTQIAYRRRSGNAPGIVWLGGYRSDMTGTKAEAIDGFCERNGQAFLRHDYSGHGASAGDFKDGTISRWLSESLTIFRRFSAGPQIIVGSSMGAWIALRMIQELIQADEAARLGGLVLLAPAPDFTSALIEPKLNAEQRRQLREQGFFTEPSDYSDEPYIYTRALFEDGAVNRVLDGIIDTHCPVHILQGKADPDVPYAHALRLAEHLPADDVTLSLIDGGDHRLSRPQDIEMMLSAIATITLGAKSRQNEL